SAHGGQVRDVWRLGDLTVGLPPPRRTAGGGVRADLALERLFDGELLTPGPDGDIRLFAADRGLGVGGVGDAEEEVLELGLDVREVLVDRRDPLACVDGTAAELRHLPGVGLGAAPDCGAALLPQGKS